MGSASPLSAPTGPLVAGVLVLAAWACPPVQAQPGPSALARAEKAYRADALLTAEPLYAAVLDQLSGRQRQRCYDRLLTIYVRLGRPDKAIRLGTAYRQWLREVQDPKPLRELDLLFGECYLALGHYRTALAYLERASADQAEGDPLPLARLLSALQALARGAARQGDRDRARRFWQRVEALAVSALDDPDGRLTPRERIACARKLAESYQFQKQPDRAVARLTPLLAIHDALEDPLGKRDTLRLLAGHEAARGDDAAAEKDLQQALALHDEHDPAGRLVRADLAAELADVQERQGRADEAGRLRDQAVADYQAALRDPGAGRPGLTGAVTAFWKLQTLYQKTTQYGKALQLTATQAEQWAGGSLIRSRLRTEEGSLRLLVGRFAEARGPLQEALAELETQSPPNLIELPRALTNLAVVELATDRADRAEALARRCRALYEQYQLPDDLVLVEVEDLLGTCEAQRGDYAAAIAHFRAGIERCARLGAEAEPAHSNLLLNIALLHKAQGDLPEALRVCREGRAVYGRFAPPGALGFAAFDAALANLCAIQGRVEEANGLATGVLETCRRYEIDRGPLVVTARHCQALYHLGRRDCAAADEAWHAAQALQETEQPSPLLPRTLNYLGLSAQLQGHPEQAEALYRRARDLQGHSPRAFPATHFITLWRLAQLADGAGRPDEARALLGEAVTKAEAARLRTYGDAQQRGTFFVQFAPAFDQLVSQEVRDGHVEAAFDAAARGRSRTLLDQLRLAGVDPRRDLHGPQGDALRREEEALRRRLSGLQARAQLLPEDAGNDKAGRLPDDYDRAQQRYAEVWREILNASPVYRSLSAADAPGAVLGELRQRVLKRNTLLLMYYFGRERSYLFLAGPGDALEAFPLTIPTTVAERLDVAPGPPAAVADAGRGLVLKKTGPSPAPVPAPDPAPAGPAAPLTATSAAALVDHYRGEIENPDFDSTRGLRLRHRPESRPLAVQHLELPAEVFLPPAVRARIREVGPAILVVVPDGALHKLPLEALLLEGGARPRYVLDELPPIVYAPSAAILALLAGRPAPRRTGPLTLLTVADPAYPEDPAPDGATAGRGPLPRGALPRLPFTHLESESIRRLFDPGQVVALEGPRARESAVVAALPGRSIVHVAAHGFADDRFGNLFGALALTPPPPGQETPGDDGFLSLHEIYALPLGDCELAVLSACVTNVGPQQPLEAGVTLASGFLSAGARRVVASHWSVNDSATAELMKTFLAEATAAERQGRPVSYAGALQVARLRVRHEAKWSAPYYWAPFVLLGPPG
jgi:CHAT domain-containing protein